MSYRGVQWVRRIYLGVLVEGVVLICQRAATAVGERFTIIYLIIGQVNGAIVSRLGALVGVCELIDIVIVVAPAVIAGGL